MLTVLSSGDFEHLDPGQAYYALDYAAVQATQRPLFSYMPNNPSTVSADLATELPSTSNGGITDGGKTITIHIRHGVRFSPPVNREVTSADVAYALERGGNPNVGNAYFPAYFGAGSPAPLVGAQSSSYKGGPIPGIKTPDKYTLVLHLTKPGATLVDHGAEPAGARRRFRPSWSRSTTPRARRPMAPSSSYSTGPYMVKADKSGKVAGVGYQPGKSTTLVRNPNWSASTDIRPAYVDEIDFKTGGDATVIGQQVLKGSHMLQLDTPAQSIVKLAYQQYPSQITFTAGSGDHYVALDNQTAPFKNVNLRRAVWADLNRAAIVKARGGSLVSLPATHFIYPGVNGYDQSGGAAGPANDFNKNVTGDIAVAQKYMKAAGYPSGKYTGGQTVQIVGANSGNSPAIIQIVNQDLTSLGFKTRVSEVDQATMYSKYCGVPKQEIDVCPTVGWIRDFADPLSVLYATFYGPAIVPTNNSNWSQTNDPADQRRDADRRRWWSIRPLARRRGRTSTSCSSTRRSPCRRRSRTSPTSRAADVAGVNQLWNEGTWDFDFTSLK